MNLNPIDCEYIDGNNTYPIQDYIDEQINLNNIIINSNITFNITSNILSSNVILNNYQKLDKSLFYQSSNLYLCNSNNFGEIRFKTSYNYPSSNRSGTIIDYTGKLLVFHNYNLLQPTFGEGYYDVEGEILALKADGINTDAQLTALEAGAIALQDEILSLTQAGNLTEGRLNSLIENIDVAGDINQLRELNRVVAYGDAYTQYMGIVNNIKNSSATIYNNSLVNGLAISAGIGLAGGAIASVATQIYYQQASNALYKNSNLTSNQKYTIYSNNTSNEVILYSNFNFSTSNLAINQGFLNSNTIAQQHISSLNTNQLKLNQTNISNIFVSSNVANQQLIQKLRTNEITLNNKAITKFSLDNLDDWIKTTNGIYYDITNGTLAINSTPNLTDFFRVGGQTTIQGDFICETKMKIDNTNIGTPNFGVNGGTGDKLILKPGTISIYPYSFGINTNNLWYSVPSGATHNFYVNASPITTISSTGLTTTGFINASTNLQENSVNLTAKYLQLSGGTMTGALTLPNTIWSIKSADNVNRVNYATNGATYFKSGNTTGNSFVFKNTADTSEVLTISNTGDLGMLGTLNISATTSDNQIVITNTAVDRYVSIKFNNGTKNGYIGIGCTLLTGTYRNNLFLEANDNIIFSSGNANTTTTPPRMILNTTGYLGIGSGDPKCHLQVRGIGNINGGNPYATNNNFMQTGSLTIGDLLLNYGGCNTWTTNTAGLMMECLNDTEIAVHDNANRVASLMYFQGGATNKLTIGRNMGWDTLSLVNFKSSVSIDNTNTTLDFGQRGQDNLIRFWTDGTNTYGIGINASVLRYNVPSGSSHLFYNGTTNTFRIETSGNVISSAYMYAGGTTSGIRINGNDYGNTFYQDATTINGQPASVGFTLRDANKFNFQSLSTTGGGYTTIVNMSTSGVGIGTNTARARLDVYNQDAIIRTTNEGGTTKLFLGTPFDANSALKCALICQGMSTWSRSKLHISLNNTADNNAFYNAAIADACATFDYNGNVGIGNTIPLDDGGNNTFLCLGSSSINGSCGNLVIAARNSAGTGHRHFRATIDTIYFTFSIGDFGSGNTIGTFVQQFIMSYLAPSNSLLISASGQVIMPFGYTTSDERIKTDITTIDNALWKVSQLRGVEYTHIQEGIRSIGVIAQEVENIIPEIVYTDTERDNLKSVNYSGLVGLLINAIKEQQEEINNLKYILRKNNIQ